ncbi:hypothetical protein NW759_008419 [Fusarium solani]|nr:hypothetical protein NW759_008419 [Fusarium solani]
MTAINSTSLPDQTPFPLAVRDEQCGFEGDSDLYGLGIRLGIYMQWLTSFAPTTDLQKFAVFRETYSIFVFAIFIAILVLTAEKRPTHTAEMLILAYIIFGGVFIAVPAGLPKKNSTFPERKGFMACLRHGIVLNLFGCAVAGYFFWFWHRGMRGDNFLATPCGSHAFLFAKVSLSNRHITRTLSCASAAFVFLAMHRLLLVFRVYKKRPWTDGPARNQLNTTEEGRRMVQDEREEDRKPRWKDSRFYSDLVQWCYRIFSLVYFVLGIELTLYWNGVTDVYSVGTAGQLIPLIIGVCGLAKGVCVSAAEFVARKPDRGHSQQSDVEAGGVVTT